ncbi:unnamed protein product [Macrosiphum euphorbiae]|uniref:Uncharacterized protein n=1 Tax=Macrosiphum euphorbiae TaxID=13131 RepID=A0AAV0Y5J5_9HEMI|nr:unnamed protein product [Macrosiphum euphorbiae]
MERWVCGLEKLNLIAHFVSTSNMDNSNNSGFRSKQLKFGENNFSYNDSLDIFQKSPDLVEESYDITDTFLENINGEVFLSSAQSESNQIDENKPVVFVPTEQSQQNMEQSFENIVRNGKSI